MRRYCIYVTAATLVAATVLTGCRLGRGPTIAEILAEPGKYEGKTISVKGTVRTPVQVAGMGGMVLEDETGKLTVLTAGTSRAAGSEVTIRGTVEIPLNFGNKKVVVLKEEGAKTPDGGK